MHRRAMCTIIAKNYIAFARTLARSFERHNPGVPVYVLVIDDIAGFVDGREEPFQLVALSDLKIPGLSSFCFKYDVTELATAAKPYFLEYLLHEKSIDHALYLDPDIYVTHKLDVLFDLFSEASILLTPHLDSDYPEDGLLPDDAHILRSGVFNLGCIGVSAGARDFLSWWQRKVHHNCVVDHGKGYFTDQRFIDLASTLFEGIKVVRDVGFNVAYWNLHSRSLGRVGPEWRCNNGPLYFFHFSGYRLENEGAISKHQTRFSLGNRPDLRPLFDEYRNEIQGHGYLESRSWPYSHGQFRSGRSIPLEVRKFYWGNRQGWPEYGDPFSAASLEEMAAEFEIQNSSGVSDGRGRLRRGQLESRRRDVAAMLYRQIVRSVEPFLIPPLRRLLPKNGRLMRQLRFLRVQMRSGVNVTGYFESEKGVGEAARATLRALEAAGIPHVMNSVRDTASANVAEGSVRVDDDNPFAINLLHVNADQTPGVASKLGAAYLRGHYNIGFWFWELADFPSEWLGSFKYLQEVWVASEFVYGAVTRVSPVKVSRIPLAVDNKAPAPSRRGDLGIPEDVFLFLFMFDYHSFVERKNPVGLLRAFRDAFGDREDVLLVLKSSHGEESPEADELRNSVGKARNVRLIDAVLPGEKVRQLLALSDCYVALHRSEGFGLPIAEAMALGKPVIATGYSGNMDFMTPMNSMPVKYRLVEIGKDHGPYRKGYTWAEPDLEDAASLMRRLREDPGLATSLGSKAKGDMESGFSAGAVGRQIAQRLARIMAP